MEKHDFARRLTELRMQKNVSARDMSLSIGQSPGYINNIENCVNYPSMSAFFYICEYLGITPQAFFETETASPGRLKELHAAAQGLGDEQLDHLIAIAKGLRR